MHGRHAEAQLLQEKALAEHPDNQIFKRSLPIGLYFMGLFEEAEKLNSDSFDFKIYLVEGRHEDAKALLDKVQEENPGSWSGYERMYYRVAGGEQRLKKLADAIERQLAAADEQEWAWRDNCSTNLIYDLRQTGLHEDAVDSMMAQCDTEFEERLNARYICPCQAQRLIHYTILDNRFDEAVERAEQWLASWPTIDLATDPIFKLLSGRPEYQELLDRNAELIERQKHIYLAGKEAESAQSLDLAE
jgi:tetratricopeptide (TPR) repeat protein